MFDWVDVFVDLLAIIFHTLLNFAKTNVHAHLSESDYDINVRLYLFKTIDIKHFKSQILCSNGSVNFFT